MPDMIRDWRQDPSAEDCAVLCIWGNTLRKLTIKLPAVRVQLVYKTFWGERSGEKEMSAACVCVCVWGGGGGKGGVKKGMSAVCAGGGKQAESPVRGKFTFVWRGVQVEERRGQCCRGHSHRRESRMCFLCQRKKRTEHWPRKRSRGWRRWVRHMQLWKWLKENRFSW